jgi:hypothetical protein
MEATEDRLVGIAERSPGRLRYRDLISGAEWILVGDCNRCGLCEIGAVGRRLLWSHAPGTRGACVDLDYARRRDIPMRPPLLAGCSLREG